VGKKMRKLFATLLVMMVGWSGTAVADKPMVVVELYTSQGCSSCPPADDILTELSKQDDVLALGLHVDYWDYLGWKDEFAVPAFSERQQNYNAILPSRYRLVTPQMVIHGLGQVAGGTNRSVTSINSLVEEARSRVDRAAMTLARDEDQLTINLSAIDADIGPSTVQLVHFIPKAAVNIKSGENRGRKIEYTNVVAAWETVSKWDGTTEVTLTHKLTDVGRASIAIGLALDRPNHQTGSNDNCGTDYNIERRHLGKQRNPPQGVEHQSRIGKWRQE